MGSKELAKKVFRKMYDNDPFSKWLGIDCLEMDRGKCLLKMTVQKKMLNGFSIAHGGICYALADSALAFASNSHGRKCISIETSISHTASLSLGDVIKAITKEIFLGNKTAIYHITILNQNNKTVALFKGTVYRTSKFWFQDER
jgi:acyl-CoA thioesterase